MQVDNFITWLWFILRNFDIISWERQSNWRELIYVIGFLNIFTRQGKEGEEKAASDFSWNTLEIKEQLKLTLVDMKHDMCPTFDLYCTLTIQYTSKPKKWKLSLCFPLFSSFCSSSTLLPCHFPTQSYLFTVITWKWITNLVRDSLRLVYFV